MIRGGFAVLAAGLGIALAAAALPAKAQSAVAGTPIVIGQSFIIESGVMGGPREINVWLPPSYGEGGQAYPVVYLLDGGQAQDFHHISGLAQLGTVNGTTRDVIVVGVASKDRRNELAFRARTDASLVADYPTHGQSDRFRRFLSDEVMPFVNAAYRTDGDDAVIGESLAGLFVMETFLRQPELFDRYISISPSLWWDNGALVDEAPALVEAQAYFPEDAPHERVLWHGLSNEGEGMEVLNNRLNDALRTPRGFVWITSYRDESHATIYHPAALDALRAQYRRPTPTP